MKFINAVLFVLVVLSGHTVSAHEDGALAETSKRELGISHTEPGSYTAYKFDSVGGSCGCAGDAAHSIHETYHAKVPTLLPIYQFDKKQYFYLKAKDPPITGFTKDRWLSTVIKKCMLMLVKQATAALANVDCGDCTGKPLNYCGAAHHVVGDGAHGILGDGMNGKPAPVEQTQQQQQGSVVPIGFHTGMDKPSTYDCCCDARRIREIVESCLCSLAEDVVVKDPQYGDFVYSPKFQSWVAHDIWESCRDAISETASAFCNYTPPQDSPLPEEYADGDEEYEVELVDDEGGRRPGTDEVDDENAEETEPGDRV